MPSSPNDSIISTSEIFTTTESDFQLKVSKSKDSALRSRLYRLLSLDYSSSNLDEIEINTPTLTHRRLTNHKRVFEKLKADPEVKRDLRDMLPIGRTAYMVVGLVEIDCASINRSKQTTKGSENSVTLPVVDVALAAASVPVSLGGIGDVEVENETTRSYNSVTTSITEDKEIIAFEYRLIRRSLGGWGRQVVYRDSIPKTKAGLTFGASEVDEEDTEDDEDDLEILDLALSVDSTRALSGKAAKLDAETGIIYH